MSINALTGTEHIASDNRGKFGIIICCAFHGCLTDGDSCALLYAAHFTTAIDITCSLYEVFAIKSSHCTVSDDDVCCAVRIVGIMFFIIHANHSKPTVEGICTALKGFTLTATEYVFSNRRSIADRNRFFIHCA